VQNLNITCFTEKAKEAAAAAARAIPHANT